MRLSWYSDFAETATTIPFSPLKKLASPVKEGEL